MHTKLYSEHQGKIPLTKPEHKWEDNMKTDPTQTGFGSAN